MSDAPAPKRPVFLSYASEDADTVARIADALRATGVEVWFDKNELRGGDAWDQKIRRQIKDCALFVPVISAATQARPEGYFRLEWKLAVDRSHLMSDDHAFLVPVIVDDTPEPAARVPDRFRDFQWTRLMLTETPAAFAERMQQLLRRDAAGPRSGQTTEAGKRKRDASVLWTRVVPICGLIVGMAYALSPMWRTRRAPSPRPDAPKPSVAAPANSPAAAPSVSEARKLMAQAKALYEPWDGATRADFAVAEKLLTLAVDKDPADGEVWAALGLVHCGQIALGFDRSEARLEKARMAAERAIRLAPDAVQAKFAQAFTYRFSAATRGSAEKTLRALVEEAPTDRLLLRTLSSTLREQGKFDDAVKVLDRAIALPGGDPVAEYNQFQALSGALKFSEAEALLDRSIAAHPQPYFYRAKAQVLMSGHGDLDGAAELVKKLPPAYLLEDVGAYWAGTVWMWRREPEKALEIWKAITRDLIETNEFNGPRAFLVGQANQLAKRTAAADADWKAALRLVERLHAEQPNVIQWVYWKARLFALLDRKAEAEEALKTFEQLLGARGINNSSIPVYLLLGRKSEVLDAVEKAHATFAKSSPTQLTGFTNNLRFNPEWDLLREEPRFQKLIAK